MKFHYSYKIIEDKYYMLDIDRYEVIERIESAFHYYEQCVARYATRSEAVSHINALYV